MLYNFPLRGISRRETYLTKKGFTLVELLIVFAVIAILSAILVADFPEMRQQLALKRAAYKLAQDIRWAQEMAMAAEEVTGCKTPGPGGGYREGYKYGFGIYFEKKEGKYNDYILFADCDGNNKYQGVTYDFPVDLIDFDMVEVDPNNFIGQSNVKFNIVFISPNSTVSFTKENPDEVVTANEVTIKLIVTANPSKYKNVIVNKAGLIYVE